ncbi:MAG: hypothetical protein ACLRI8_04850 [Agathobacter rectalis]
MNDKKYSLRPYLLAYKWHYAIGIFVLLAVDLANLYIPQFIGEIIDGITAGKLDMAGVGGIIFKILITGLIIMAGRFGWRYFIIGASRGIEYRLRDDMFSHMETLSARITTATRQETLWHISLTIYRLSGWEPEWLSSPCLTR